MRMFYSSGVENYRLSWVAVGSFSVSKAIRDLQDTADKVFSKPKDSQQLLSGCSFVSLHISSQSKLYTFTLL